MNSNKQTSKKSKKKIAGNINAVRNIISAFEGEGE